MSLVLTDSIGAGVQINLGPTAEAWSYIGEGVTVASTNFTAIFGNGLDQRVTVAGQVVGSGYDAISLDGGSAVLEIQDTARVTAATGTLDSKGVDLGAYAVLTNAGFVSGRQGVDIYSGSIVNSGSIVGSASNGSFGEAIFVSGLGVTNITNTGLISGFDKAIETAAANSIGVNLVNYNDIIGNLVLFTSDTRAQLITNFGIIAGSIYTDEGRDKIDNFGTMDGNIFTYGGDDIVTNEGTIIGNLYLGENNDSYDAVGSGYVTNFIVGDSGNDVIKGGSQDDRIDGGTDDDLLIGRAGDDYLIGRDGNDTIRGGLGMDEIVASAGDDTAYGGEGRDDITGGDGDDDLYGNAGDDEIYGEGDNDTIYGGRGDDEIHGGADADILNGGRDSDTVFGGNGNDSIDGNRDDDFLFGDAGNDGLNGGQGDDYLSGGVGNDFLLGHTGNDQLSGGKGADLLFGGRGDDNLYGGGGTDTFLFMRFADNDIVHDFKDGADVLDFSDFGAGSFSDIKAASSNVTGGVLFDLSELGGIGTVLVEGVVKGDLGVDDFVV